MKPTLPATLAATSLALLTLAFGPGGCAATGGPSEQRTVLASSSGPNGQSPSSPSSTARTRDTANADRSVALLINGNPVAWETLRPLLAEAAGAEVVDELALEAALRDELRAKGMTIGGAEIDAARENWIALLEDSGVAAEADAAIRARRGLGPERFRRLLWRNAALRALLSPSDTTVTEAEIGLAQDVRTGRRYLISGVVCRDAPQAVRIATAARGGNSPLAGLWAAADADDLRPFQTAMSPLDPAFPESIRRALPSLPVGTPSGAIAVEDGYAVVLVNAVLEPTAESRSDAELRRDLSIRKTRLAMEQLARRLLSRTEVSRLDRSLLD